MPYRLRHAVNYECKIFVEMSGATISLEPPFFGLASFGRKHFAVRHFVSTMWSRLVYWLNFDLMMRSFSCSNVSRPNVCCPNVCQPKVPNVCWQNVFWTNVFNQNICWKNVFCPEVYQSNVPNVCQPNVFWPKYLLVISLLAKCLLAYIVCYQMHVGQMSDDRMPIGKCLLAKCLLVLILLAKFLPA